MMKFAVAAFCFVLLSGCVSQHNGGTLPNWLSATDTPTPRKQAASTVPLPVAEKAKKKALVKRKKPLVTATLPKPVTKKRVAKPKSRPAIVAPAPKAASRTSVATNAAKPNCQEQFSSLPSDADTRSETSRVQCFFISRGEYITTSGAVKALQ